MKLSKNWTTITPLSKTLALIMVIILPFIGAYIGYQLRANALPGTNPTEIQQKSPMIIADTESEIIRRCGDFSREELGINFGHYTIVDGPKWAPDCRHIAWSVWQSGTSVITPPGEPEPSFKPNSSPLPIEGIFIYDDRTKKTLKVIAPKAPGENPVLFGWDDSNRIIFTKNGEKGREKFYYDLSTKKVESE